MLHLLFRGVMVYVQRKASDVLKNRLYQRQMTVNASYVNVLFLQYISNKSDLSLYCVRDHIAHRNESGTSDAFPQDAIDLIFFELKKMTRHRA